MSIGTLRRSVAARLLLTLAAASASVLLVNAFAPARGLRPAVSLRGASQAYTHQMAGYVRVPDDGAYRLAIESSGPSRLSLDDVLIADVPDGGGEANSSSPVPAGEHRLVVQYTPTQPRTASRLELLWSRDADPFVRVPSHALAPRGLRSAEWQLRAASSMAALALAFAWVAAAIWFAARGFRRWLAHHEVGPPGTDRVLTSLLALALALHAFPLWWGLPNLWAQDELEPVDVLLGLRDGFVNGWHMKYPPLQIYLLAVLYLPMLVFVQAGLLEPAGPAVGISYVVLNRVLTVAMSVATTALVYVCGRLITRPRAAALGALTWTLVLPLVYYGKLANVDVPFTFWFAVSLVGYVRGVLRGDLRDFVLFGAGAAAAVTTKDQAYGLYLLPALHLAWTRIDRHRSEGIRVALTRTLSDRPLLAGTAAGLVVFAAVHNIVFNWSGAVEHFRLITGGVSQDYRQVDSLSWRGQAWLFGKTIDQIAWSMSLPGALAAAGGIVAVVRTRRTQPALLMLLLPIVSYHVTFVAVVGYVYDRFLLPVCLLLALYAGEWFHRVWRPDASRLRTVAVVAVFVYMAWRTASIDLLMAADRRYQAEAWMKANIPAGAEVGVLEWRQVLPDLTRYRTITLGSPPGGADPSRPETIVVSAGYPKRYEPNSQEAQWYEAALRGERGYRVALRAGRQPPLAILAHERPFREMHTHFTILPKVSPEIVVLVRETDAGS